MLNDTNMVSLPTFTDAIWCESFQRNDGKKSQHRSAYPIRKSFHLQNVGSYETNKKNVYVSFHTFTDRASAPWRKCDDDDDEWRLTASDKRHKRFGRTSNGNEMIYVASTARSYHIFGINSVASNDVHKHTRIFDGYLCRRIVITVAR